MEARVVPPVEEHRVDHCVVLRGVPWDQYEALLEIRGDDAGPRMTYLHGDLEFMSPSQDHEAIARMLGRLVEVYCEHLGLDVSSYGSWTLRSAGDERGLEPDGCYVFGEPDEPRVPDLAIEVEWSRRGIDKLEVYRGLAVPEVWRWSGTGIEVHVLRDGAYERTPRSGRLPELDLDLVASLATAVNQSKAIRLFRSTLG